MAKLYLDTVEVGDPILALQKPPITRTQIAKFAAASRDYGPLHVDEEVARASGYGSVFAHSMIAMSYVGEMLERWLENGRVARLHCKFQKFIWPGDVLSAKGVVVPKVDQDGLATIVCDVWVQNQNNDKVLAGKAVCVLYRSAEEEKKHGKGRPDSVNITSEYQSPHKKQDTPKVTGPADKPPPRPPPKASGTPVEVKHEAAAPHGKAAAPKAPPADKKHASKPPAPARPEPHKKAPEAAKKPEPHKRAPEAAKKPDPHKKPPEAAKKPEPHKKPPEAAKKPEPHKKPPEAAKKPEPHKKAPEAKKPEAHKKAPEAKKPDAKKPHAKKK